MEPEPLQTDVRFERAVLEALHAGEAYVREAFEPAPTDDRAERAFAEALHDASKWRAVARAARAW